MNGIGGMIEISAADVRAARARLRVERRASPFEALAERFEALGTAAKEQRKREALGSRGDGRCEGEAVAYWNAAKRLRDLCAALDV